MIGKPNAKFSVKHTEIDKLEARATVMIAIAAVVTVFCLVSTKGLISEAAHQRRVLHARRDAVSQLDQNLSAVNTLNSQYGVFNGSDPKNIIGGRNTTDANVQPPDGDNARIVLDALPSTYDFPALVSSVDKILSADNISNPALGGTDNSATINSTPLATPQPVPIGLTINGNTTYAGVQKLIGDLERSIRPFDVTSLSIQGSAAATSFKLTVNTYYQPAKSLSITTKGVQ